MRRELCLLTVGFALQFSPLVLGSIRISLILQLTGIALCLSALWFQGRRHKRGVRP